MLIPALIFISIIVAAVIFIWYRQHNSLKARLKRQMAELKEKTTLPNGATVYSKNPLSMTMRNAITAEFESFAEIALRHGCVNKVAASYYTIYVFPSERDYNADGVYCPSFKVPIAAGSSYDESQYDQGPGKPGGWIYAAEKVIALGECKFAIADSDRASYIRESVHNGLDHIVLFHNDIDMYAATADHSQGGGHPILT